MATFPSYLSVFKYLFVLRFVSPVLLQTYYEYCIVGGGPAGLQMGYFLHKSGRNYVIIERCDIPGCFFRTYPRHRTLISINKRFTGKKNSEYNERHDWNSLLGERDGPKFTSYSKQLFPHADEMLKYLRDYAIYYNLNVVYNQNVDEIEKYENKDVYWLQMTNLTSVNNCQKECVKSSKDNSGQSESFSAESVNWSFQSGEEAEPNVKESSHKVNNSNWDLKCRFLLMATGMNKPVRPFWADHTVHDYSTMPMDPELFTDKNVLILGSGNSAFETANLLKDTVGVIAIATRQPEISMAYQTHYVGHVRAYNLQFLDLYQLKSLAAIYAIEANSSFTEFSWERQKWVVKRRERVRRTSTEYNRRRRYFPTLMDLEEDAKDELIEEHEFDEIITCLGWKMDISLFSQSTMPNMIKIKRRPEKYPQISDIFESQNQANMYFLGTNAHSYDMTSSGGFIHGFRYQVRALHNILEQKHHKRTWPFKEYSKKFLLFHLVKRINTAAGPYQMFHSLCDVILKVPSANQISVWTYKYFPDFPIKLISKFSLTTGIQLSPKSEILVWYFKYGDNFSCVGCNTIARDRVKINPYTPEQSNFLHPVIELYSVQDLTKKKEPNRRFGLTENSLAMWVAEQMYVDRLLEFLFTSWALIPDFDYDAGCMMAAIEQQEIDAHCSDEYETVKEL